MAPFLRLFFAGFIGLAILERIIKKKEMLRKNTEQGILKGTITIDGKPFAGTDTKTHF